jgi:hypothetical protein
MLLNLVWVGVENLIWIQFYLKIMGTLNVDGILVKKSNGKKLIVPNYKSVSVASSNYHAQKTVHEGLKK